MTRPRLTAHCAERAWPRDAHEGDRLGPPAEVAALLSYLVSPEAYVSGTTVVLDAALEQRGSLS